MRHIIALRPVVACIAVCLITACGAKEKEADAAVADDAQDTTTSSAPVPQTVDVGAVTAVPDSEYAFGTVIVSHEQPSTGDSVIRITRRTPVQLPGAASAFTMEGDAGPVRHTFLIALDSAGAVQAVTHKWHNADNSVVAETACSVRTKCSLQGIGVTPASRTVLFTRFVLTGLDGNTAQKATSTLTGAVP